MLTIETARRFILGKQGLWLEDKALGKDEALARGFGRFVSFLGASKMDAKVIREPLRRVANIKLRYERL